MQCKKCKEDKPEDQFGHYGRKFQCKECCLAYFREYNAKNPDKRKKATRKYNENNKEAISIRRREYRNRPEVKEKERERKRVYNSSVKGKISRKKYAKSEKGKEKSKLYRKKYYEENKENIREKRRKYVKKYYQENKEKINERQREYYKNNKEKFREIRKRYIAKNGYIWERYPKYRISKNISRQISGAIRGGKSGRSIKNILPYTIEQLVAHLEKQFRDGMSWDNYGIKGWQIDHIKPVSFFSFEDVEDPQVKECWALENLRPMWSSENNKKGDSMEDFQRLKGRLF